jgi:hypothetical protein
VTVPASFDIAQFVVGRDVELVVTRQPNGSFQLVRGFQELAGGTDPLDRNPTPLPTSPLPPTGTTPGTGGTTTPATGGTPAGGTPAATTPTTTAPATLELQGIVQGIDGQNRKVTLSNGATPGAGSSTFVVPQPFDMSRFWAGQDLHVEVMRLADGTLEFRRIIPPPPVQVLRFKGTIVSVDGQARTLTVRTCDSSSCSGPAKVLVPPTFDLTKFRVGQKVELQVTTQSDGTYVLQRATWSSRDREDDDSDD